MKCETSDVEIQTLVSRIKEHDMDLQPSFQRGEIWPLQKKKKLIDSILRGWRIPPIHVVQETVHMIDEVLDGQQRLAAIRDFYNNEIRIDGKIAPLDESISALDGKCYDELPVEWKRKFQKYIVNIVRLTEYKPQEPAELFYRLNQPASLTSAEQRNAYIGDTRDQVKDLSKRFIEMGADKKNIGFSNSRLAYDEVISKFCYTIEIGTLTKKITSTDISEKYRQNTPFSEECIRNAGDTLQKFMDCVKDFSDFKFAFNKATLYSWLIFIRQRLSVENAKLRDVIANFEYCRAVIKGKYRNVSERYKEVHARLNKSVPNFEVMLNTFNQRSSMGSTDALSVVYRDIILSIFCDAYFHRDEESELLQFCYRCFQNEESMTETLANVQTKYHWGESFQ